MIGVVYDRMVAVDTSAVIALRDPDDQFHDLASEFFETSSSGFAWFTVNVTSHELFTHTRYNEGLSSALDGYDFIRKEPFQLLDFSRDDEDAARELLAKYDDQKLSFHDALCAAIMIRKGIFKIFSFDSDYWMFGFEVLPGATTTSFYV